jgi:phosphate transport system ATP-binding protein
MTPKVQASLPGETAVPNIDHDKVAIQCKIEELFYGDFLAVRQSHVNIQKNYITGFIGPSGCGKSTVLRCINRMNDLIRSFRFKGQLLFHGIDIYEPGIDPVAVRRHIGMVFQQPNPFSMSIYDNVAFGLRLNRYKGDLSDRVEHALQRAGLWNEVEDKLRNNGLSLSGGQQQRLCIARALGLADGRALLGPGPHSHPGHRRIDAGAETEIHHCHCDP